MTVDAHRHPNSAEGPRPRKVLPFTAQARAAPATMALSLSPALVARVRQRLDEEEIRQTVEAALLAALDYREWLGEVERGADPFG